MICAGKPVTLGVVHPNAGLTARYTARLDKLIAAMQADTLKTVRAAFKVDTPEMTELAEDASPAVGLRMATRRLAVKWQKRFDEAAPELARYFSVAAADRSDKALAALLKKGGFTVRFRMSRPVNDVVQASIGAQVALIKSIPAQHMLAVQGSVMRATQTGRDIGTLTDEIEAHGGVTRRRAAFIAKDQVSKTTASVVKARQQELGLQAIWMHSGGGREPRPSHVAFSGKAYDPAKGVVLDGELVWPGTAINCRCVSRSVVPGLS